MFPLVSIIIPVFNQRIDFLEECINSALRQSYPNFEIIISDNHSRQEVGRYLHSLQSERIFVVSPPAHLAILPHFNFASKFANGEFISFLSSDDLVEEDWLANLVPGFIEHSSAHFAFGEIGNVRFENSTQIDSYFREGKMESGFYSQKDLFIKILPFGSDMSWFVGDLIRKSSFIEVNGFNEMPLNYAGDHGLFVRLIALGGCFYLNKMVGKHRRWGMQNGKTESNRVLKTVADVFELYKLLEKEQRLALLVGEYRGSIERLKKRAALIQLLQLCRFVPQSKEEANEVELLSKTILSDSGGVVANLLYFARKSGLAKPLAVGLNSLRLRRLRLFALKLIMR